MPDKRKQTLVTNYHCIFVSVINQLIFSFQVCLTLIMATRSNNAVWLIGQPNKDILGSRLPTKLSVMKKYFFHQKQEQLGRRKSVNLCLDAVMPFWEKARIPTMRRDNAIRKIESLLKRYDKLVKNKKRSEESCRVAEEVFMEEIKNEILDIGHSKALCMMKNEEDKSFYISQQDDPAQSSMGSVDMKMAKIESRKRHREEKQAELQDREIHQSKILTETAILEDSSPSSDEQCDPSLDACTSTLCRKKKRSKNFINQDVAVAYDRMNISIRDAAMSYSVVAQSLGQNLDEISISASTMYRARKAIRKQVAVAYQGEEFCPGEPLVLHWDGKMLPTITGNRSEDRIAILVSGKGQEKLLGIPKIPAGTGAEIARVCIECIREHHLSDRIKGLSFDTTSSNTGIHAGACTKIEDALEKQLLYLACRHHIYEIVLAKAFHLSMGPTTGPNIEIFKRLKNQWNEIDRSLTTSCTIAEPLQGLRDKTILIVRKSFAICQQRDDYKELLQLVLLFLGEETTVNVPLRKPGAYHNARWMAKAIYALKLYLLQDQFKMTELEHKGVTEICLFVALAYAKAWCRAPRAEQAPAVDLEFLQDMETLQEEGVIITVAKEAQAAMKRHLWYLSEALESASPDLGSSSSPVPAPRHWTPGCPAHCQCRGSSDPSPAFGHMPSPRHIMDPALTPTPPPP
ncbi:uncharacterized protein LOC126989930 [Eriocheir sinensis]|uniref:uncharacterized protein LOC126989930 n=1 Tax=Eriocheir sinensis TaxID=95602 RepID=UPI0021CA5E19|nr:uncharacterized protein LOC126989930 [Eriocheir sinensis]